LGISKLVFIEILMLIIGAIFALFWVRDPSGNFEPYIVVTGIILASIELFRRKKSERSSLVSDNTGELQPQINLEPSDITVKQIIDEVNELPLFQKSQASENYSGIRVSWTGYLKRIMEDPRDKSKIRVNLKTEQDHISGYNFWFSVALEQFPEIKVLKENSAIQVMGKISSVTPEGLCVELEHTEQSFPN
jgi:hypothetical protein